MGAATGKAHILGREQQFFANPETTPGQYSAPATGDSINVLTSTFTPNVKRNSRVSSYSAHRDITERTTSKSEHSWSVEGEYTPSGTKDVPPAFGDLIQAALGVEAIGADEVTYSTNSVQTITTLTIIRQYQSLWQEAMAGAWVDELTMKFASGVEPLISLSGGAMDYASTGYSTTDGALSGGESALAVAAGDGVSFHDPQSAAVYARSLITVGSSAGHEVTARTVDALTIGSAIVGAQSSGVSVVPYTPTHTDVGSPIAGITGGLSWDSLAFALTAFEFTVKNNHKAAADHCFVPHTDDVIAGARRTITGKFSVKMRQDFINKFLARQDFATKALSVWTGGAAESGTRLEVDLGYCELDYTPANIPAEEEGTLDFSFQGLGSAGNDAIELVST